MKLPKGDLAFIPSAKLQNYLLSVTHPVGQAKARFFREFDFDETNSSFFEKGLLLIAQTEDVVNEAVTAYGIKYVIDGELLTPSGVYVNVRTVWIVEYDQDFPRFVTAYPLSK